MHLDPDAPAALEKAANEAEKARQRGEARKNKTCRTPQTTRNGKNGDESGVGASSG
ncbi:MULTISPECIES: hypothetical protein [unclassified Kitasatospora]|uniref:hypothetical protein n=1 Tax=unclassified Kitasatospora TaxID=2633591 RepID=UPI0033EB1D56